MQTPFFEQTQSAKNILLVGAGGGFDIVSGIALYSHFRQQGKSLVLANLSFSALDFSGSEEVCPGTFRISRQSDDLPYFPEKYILDWIADAGHECPPMYGFSDQIGVRPLAAGYTHIIEQHHIDTIILVDGGTDSLMFGDEVRVGTIIEDACSIVAANLVMPNHAYLAAIGFGVEHDFNHHACLENIATLSRSGSFLGSIALTNDMQEGKDFVSLVEYLNQKMPLHRSIVNNSIASAVIGSFGDQHFTQRTKGSTQFVSPFMSLYWFFNLKGIHERLQFARDIINTETKGDIVEVYQRYRSTTPRRPDAKIPLS